MAKKTLKDLGDLHGSRVLVRVDFNVPLDPKGQVSNDRRLRAALPTIQYLVEQGARVILMSHLGRPKGDRAKDARLTMDRVAAHLSRLLGKKVQSVNEVVGLEVEEAVGRLEPGDVLLLENLRFEAGEQAGDESFARRIAALGDVYVNDAFGTCHRSDASMVAVPRAMTGKPRVVGFLVARELEILGNLLGAPNRPFLAILGGAKVSDKIGFIKSLLTRVDRVLVGGAMSYTFMKSQGRPTGNSKVEKDKLDVARELLDFGKAKIVLPEDHLAVQKVDAPETRRICEKDIADELVGVDIGPRTIARYRQAIDRAGTIIWNGPMGKYEDPPYALGTREIAEALAASKGVTVVGGGETAEAVEEFGLADRLTHVSTGGGAFLEYIEGTPFPALAEIDDRA